MRLLVTDGNTSYPSCVFALGVSHEALNRSSGECVRGGLHIQNVNSRHSRLKGFIGGRRGISIKHLASDLRYYHLIVLQKNPASRFCLASAMGAMKVNTIREWSVFQGACYDALSKFIKLANPGAGPGPGTLAQDKFRVIR